MWMPTATSTLLLGVAAILACSEWAAAASRDDWEDFDLSPASPFGSFMPELRGGGYKCKTNKLCVRKGGECVESGTCLTIEIKAKCKVKDGDKCSCCAKDKKARCKPSDKCTDKGGFCVINKKACAQGKLMKRQCKCKGKWGKLGHCCIPMKPPATPEPTTPEPTTPEPTTPESCHHWTYSGICGPVNWPGMYPMYCAGTFQSPIQLGQGNVNEFKYLPNDPWVFNYYDSSPNDITIKNNGHSASITWNGVMAASVSGGYLGGEYNLHGLHFHWGSDSTKGSEHHLADSYGRYKKFPLELHLVHYNAAYGDISTAITKPGGLAVLGVMFEIDTAPNPNLSPIIDALSSVIEVGSSTMVSFTGSLMDLLPPDTDVAFRYNGSLTTPTCNEVVIWTVFESNFNYISDNQLNAFRNLKFEDGSPMVNNFRPIQPLNYRIVDLVCPWLVGR